MNSTVAGVVFGAVLSWLISRYYHTRTLRARVSAYVHYIAPVLRDVDDAVRSDLRILYRENEIHDLTLCQVMVVNEGDRAVVNPIAPFRLELPARVRVLDTQIAHTEPEDRNLSTRLEVTQEASVIYVECPLLQKREYFVLRIISNGTPSVSDFKFHVTAEGLPSTIAAQKPLFFGDEVGGPAKRGGWRRGFLVLQVIMTSVLLSSLYGLILLGRVRPDLMPSSWSLAATVAVVFERVALGLWGAGTIVGLFLVYQGMRAEFFPERPSTPFDRLPETVRRRPRTSQ